MSARATRYVKYGQLSLAFFSLVCLALHPGFVLKWDEGGFSNYGIHIKTVIPYTLGFGLASYLSLLGAHGLRRAGWRRGIFAWLLRCYGLLMLLTLVSTYVYTRSVPLKDFHTVVGIATMLFEPVASLWMYFQLTGTSWSRGLLGIELLGFALGAIDYFDVLHVLFLAQLIIAVPFGFMLVRTSTVTGVA
jgi:hypothetical protein